MAENKIYNLAIIGIGAAGSAASIYASRYGINHIIIGNILAGQIPEAHKIDNYPGVEDITGIELAKKMAAHAQKYGAVPISETVKDIFKAEQGFEIELQSGNKLLARAVLLATGTRRKKLEIPGEAEFLGKGISYCATCDGFFYKNKVVAVIGGGDSAASASLYLSNIASKVYLIYRGENLRAEPYWQESIKKSGNIEVIYKTNVIEFKGNEIVKNLVLDNAHKNNSELKIDGVFVEIGSNPNIGYAKNLRIAIDSSGHIEVQPDGSTSIEGVWAAGDITTGSDKFRQIITAAAEGAIAARSIFNYLKVKNFL